LSTPKTGTLTPGTTARPAITFATFTLPGRGSAARPPPPVAAARASSLRAPSRGDPPHDGRCAPLAAAVRHAFLYVVADSPWVNRSRSAEPRRPLHECDESFASRRSCEAPIMRGVAPEVSAQRACERSSERGRGARSAPPIRSAMSYERYCSARGAAPIRSVVSTKTLRPAERTRVHKPAQHVLGHS
jgi:hypothetical protein